MRVKIKNCPPSRLKNYKGLIQPRCNDGAGCPACWAKYDSKPAIARRMHRRGKRTR